MTTEQIKTLAEASRLSLTNSECERFCCDLEALEALCEPLLLVSETPSDQYRARGTDALREDCVGTCLPIEAVREMAPAWEEGYIPVPRAVEGGGAS